MTKTKLQFEKLSDLYDYYNKALFNGELATCLLNLSRMKGARGFFAPESWTEKDAEKPTHEISITPDSLEREPHLWHSTLVHEMCHLWQRDHGKAPRRCYHDKEFAAKMFEIGLQTSHNGEPGGKPTGQKMTHYIIEGGAFQLAYNEIDEEQMKALTLPLLPAHAPVLKLGKAVGVTTGGGDDSDGDEDEAPKTKSGTRYKYSCECEDPINIWGKAGLDITCNVCECTFK